MMKVHFIAIGGSIMHGMAIALKRSGHEVSGSDDKIYDPAKSNLAAEDLLPEDGWDASRIHENLDAVILGMHAFEDNPELLKARELGIPIYSFPEFIFQQSKNKHRIVVAGSYGKTTVTSMVMHALQKLEFNFDYLVGASVPGFDNSVKLTSDAPIIVIEGDEYLASKLDRRPKFMLYKPHMVCFNGVSWDHINVFPTEEMYNQQFQDLFDSLSKAADVIYNADDPFLDNMIKEDEVDESFYLHPFSEPDYEINEGVFELKIEQKRQALQVRGKHNMSNVLATWKIIKQLGVDAEDFCKAIASFKGASSRMEVVANQSDAIVIKDYAHAPAKGEATVKAVRESYPESNLIACYELHTFSSLSKNFLPHYGGILDPADTRIVFLDPHALERKRMEPISTAEIQAAFGEVEVVNDKATLQEKIKANSKGEDIILLMSSGTFGGLNLGSL